MKKFLIITGLVIGLLFNFNLCGYCNEDTDIARIKAITEIGSLTNSNKYAEALEQCNKALKLYPNDVELYYWRATIEFSLGKYEQSIKDYDKALSLNPNSADIYVMRGIVKSEIADSEGAMADFNQAIKLNPKTISAYTMRACLKLDLGDLDGANADLNMANKLSDEAEHFENAKKSETAK